VPAPLNNYKDFNTAATMSLFYIIDSFTSMVNNTGIVEVERKSQLMKSGIRILAGSFRTEDEARDAIPQAMELKRRWDVSSPVFYTPPVQIDYFRSTLLAETRGQEPEQAPQSFESQALASFDEGEVVIL